MAGIRIVIEGDGNFSIREIAHGSEEDDNSTAIGSANTIGETGNINHFSGQLDHGVILLHHLPEVIRRFQHPGESMPRP